MVRWVTSRILFVAAVVGISSCFPAALAQEVADVGVDASAADTPPKDARPDVEQVHMGEQLKRADDLNKDLEELKNALEAEDGK